MPDIKNDKEKLSRQERAKRDGNTAILELPPLEGCGYLISWLFECGPVNNGGMGQVPLTWTDIKDWSGLMGVDVTGWEAGVLKRLSSAYLSEYQQAKDPGRPAPYRPDMTASARASVSNKIGSVFGAMIKRQETK